MRLLSCLLLAACGGSKPVEPTTPMPPAPEPPAEAPPATLRLDPVAPSAGADRMVTPVSTSGATLGGERFDIAYTVIARAEDQGFGQIHDQQGAVIEDCHEQDFNSMLWAHDRPWLISHFECTPGATYVTALDQSDDGTLSMSSTADVDWSSVGGLWFPCSGQVSPWGTHLGSEEYEPNAANHQPDGTMEPDSWKAWSRMMRWWTDPKEANPYQYGWTPELTITDAEGGTAVVKHLAPGRFSHEIAYVLPDQRTTYMSDDGGAVGWFMFVADTEADLSAGTLYAAKLTQTSELDGGRFTIAWISLGHASDADIRPLIDSRVRFDEMFVVTEPDGSGSCEEGSVWTYHSHGNDCLRLAEPSERVPDPALAASRLETRRYAAMLGATTEFHKGEGVSYDPDGGRVFVVMSKIGGRMAAEPDAGVDDIRLPENRCGAVYMGHTGPDAVDTTGAAIPSAHVMHDLLPYVLGRPISADAEGNRCATSGIANPDNITYLPKYDLLAIGEDTSYHRNAALWMYEGRSGALTRAMVAPRYGEVTGIHWIPDLGGHGYLTVAVQHPWGEMPKDAVVPDNVTDADRRSFTGVLGPFPPLD